MNDRHRAFVPPHTILGESPLYRESDNTLHYIDFIGQAIHILKLDDTLARRTIQCPEPITFLCFHKGGGYVVCSRSSIVRVLDDGEWTVMKEVLTDITDVRLNDAGIDSAGKLWVGGFDLVGEAVYKTSNEPPDYHGKACLYRYDPNGTLKVMQDGGVIGGNGICWSPDDKTMYFVDSKLNCIWAYDFDAASSQISNRRAVVIRDQAEGEADGLVTDSDGNLYTFSWGGGDIVKYNPEGVCMQRWQVNAARVTHGAWVGEAFDDLVVTSALQDDRSPAWEGEEAGGLFYLRKCGARGVKKYAFG